MALVSSIVEKFKSKINSKYFSLLEEKGFPKIKDDRWKYTKTINIFSQVIEKEDFSLSSNIKSKKIEDFNFRYVDDSFALLSLSLADHIEYFNLKDDKLILDNSLAKGSVFKPIVIEVEGTCNIIEKFSSNEEVTFFPLIYVYIKESSKLNYTKIQNYRGITVDNTIVELENSAKLKTVTFSKGAKVSRNNLKVVMRKDSEAKLDGVYSVTSGHLDNFLRIEHLERSSSSQKYKGVVEKGKVSFAGSIYIDNNAPGTSSHQLNKTILLDDEGEVNTKPELEILNDDVECSHGATVGSIDKAQLFYLMTRGITEREAKKMLIDGFLNDLLDDSNREEVLSCF